MAANDLATGIGFLAMVSVDAEILCIIKSAFVVIVRHAVCPHLLRYGGRILAQEAGNVLEGRSLVQFVFDVNAVVKSEVFLVPWYVFAHRFLLLLLPEGRINNTIKEEKTDAILDRTQKKHWDGYDRWRGTQEQHKGYNHRNQKYSVSFETCQGHALTGGWTRTSSSESKSILCASRYERVNINCAEVNSTA